jgi:hypothetical protein
MEAQTAAANLAEEGVASSHAATAPIAPHRYRWRTGECLATYGISAKLWKDFSSSDTFATAF